MPSKSQHVKNSMDREITGTIIFEAREVPPINLVIFLRNAETFRIENSVKLEGFWH